jgi:single-stranded DNA-binding protein
MYMNRITLIGFTGHDAKAAATQAWKEITRFSLATTKRYQQDSEWKEKTYLHDSERFARRKLGER